MDGILGLIVVFLIYIGAAHIGLSFFGEGGSAAWFGIILGGIGLIGFIRAMNQSWKSPPDEAPSNLGTNTQTQIETTRVLPISKKPLVGASLFGDNLAGCHPSRLHLLPTAI